MNRKRTELVLGFACCLMFAVMSPSVGAELPFDVIGPDFATPAQIVDSVSNSCAAYNARVSSVGASPPGETNAPGTCGFSTFQVLMYAQPAAQYLALVASGVNPPPYTTAFKRSSSRLCAVATDVHIELNASVQPNVSSWSKAGAIGGACAAELSRHRFIDYLGMNTRGLKTLKKLGDAYLGPAVAGQNAVQVCLNRQPLPQTEALAAQKLAVAFAGRLQAVLNSNPVRILLLSWSHGARIATNCLLRCNQCGSGWAGTITNTQLIEDPTSPSGTHQFRGDEVDTYFVGGAPSFMGTTPQYPADWTSTGSGFYKPVTMDGNRTWILNAAATGDCTGGGSTQHACVQVKTDMISQARSFTGVNPPLSIDNGYKLTTGGTVLLLPAGENQFNQFITVSAAATATMASGHQVVQPAAVSTCGGQPPELPGISLTCTQTWDWQLFLQP
jgi:hypothetical protein